MRWPLAITQAGLFHSPQWLFIIYLILLNFQLAIVCICVFVVIPLNLIGTLIGRSVKGQADIPCRINVVPRPIPDKKWYLEPYVIAVAAGFLPFGSIFIEM